MFGQPCTQSIYKSTFTHKITLPYKVNFDKIVHRNIVTNLLRIRMHKSK